MRYEDDGRCPRRGAGPAMLAGLSCTVLAMMLVAGGCGRHGPERFHVEGTVTFRGQPVPSGAVRFDPDISKGNTGPVGIATIVDGRYRTDEPGSTGAMPGAVVAVISGYPAANPKVEVQPPLFPEFKTEVELVPGKTGRLKLDFDVPDIPRWK